VRGTLPLSPSSDLTLAVSYSSLTTEFTGYTAPYTIHRFTSTFTNHTTSGLVRLLVPGLALSLSNSFAVPTPFASHAFHPLDGYLQSVPYHLFIFLFPLHRWLYLGLFVFVNVWSILVRSCFVRVGISICTQMETDS
jgi:hypothetical protein